MVASTKSNILHLHTNERALSKLHTKKANEYRFHDPDPIAEDLRAAIAHAVTELKMTYAEIAADAYCTFQTIDKYASGEGKRPYNSTADRIFRACRWSRVVIKGTAKFGGKTVSAEKIVAAAGEIILNDGRMTKEQMVAILSKALGKTVK
ncbi:unnamed protein product [Sphagnum balticum]